MSRDAKKLAAVALMIFRLTRGKLSLGAAAALCVAAVLYVAVLQPVVERTLGVSLPTINAPSDSPATRNAERTPSSTPRIDPGELTEVLTEVGRGAYRSEAGLRYTRGSVHGHRLAHVLAHTVDEPDQPGQHGIFDETDPAAVVRLVDEAYTQAQSGRGVRTKREGDRTVYDVDLGRRVGTIGGESGARRGHPTAEHVRLVVEGDRLITAFPVRP